MAGSDVSQSCKTNKRRALCFKGSPICPLAPQELGHAPVLFGVDLLTHNTEGVAGTALPLYADELREALRSPAGVKTYCYLPGFTVGNLRRTEVEGLS